MDTEPQATTSTEKPLDNRAQIKVSPDMGERLEALMFGLGIKTRTQALALLLDTAAERYPALLSGHKVATFQNIMSELAPVCIFGKPGAGKSWTLKKNIADATLSGMSVILIDVPNKDYLDLEAKKSLTNPATYRAFRHKPGRIYRIVPDKDLSMRAISIKKFFEHLNILAFSGKLKEFFIAIDEGNELMNIKPVRDFLIESRKFVKKAVIVSADPTPFENICTLMRPYLKPAQ